MKAITRKQYLKNNLAIRRLAKKYGIKYQCSFSSYSKTVKRTKLWLCDRIAKSTFERFAREANWTIPGICSLSYRSMDPKSVGTDYAQVRSGTMSVYVYYF